jgi:hypothetical protein
MDGKAKAILFFCDPFLNCFMLCLFTSPNSISSYLIVVLKVLCLGHYIISVQMLYIKLISQVFSTNQNTYFIKYRHVKRLVNTRVCKSYLSICILGKRLNITSYFGPRPSKGSCHSTDKQQVPITIMCKRRLMLKKAITNHDDPSSWRLTLNALLQNSFCPMCLDDMSTYVATMGIWREIWGWWILVFKCRTT